MSVRDWNSSSEVHVPIPAGVDTTGDFSVACLVKPHAFTTDNHIMMAGVNPAGVVSWQFGIMASGVLYFRFRQPSGFPNTSISTMSLEIDEWQIVGFSGPGLSDFRKFHKRDSAGVWTHGLGDAIGAWNDLGSIAGGWIILGRELNASMAMAGLWLDTIPDTPFESLGENDASLDWTTFAGLPPIGAWNFDQTTPTEQIPDLTGNHDTISGTITDPATDPNGITGTTIVTGADLTWDFVVPPPPLDFFLNFSGGASNADPLQSHGGAMSSVVASNLIPNFPRIQAVPGVTYYTCVYVHNADDSSAADVLAHFSNIAVSTGVHIAMGAATEAAGTTVAATANSNTAPSGVTFSTPTTEGAAINLGAIGPGQGKGLWIRAILDPGSPGAIHNSVEITFNITPL